MSIIANRPEPGDHCLLTEPDVSALVSQRFRTVQNDVVEFGIRPLRGDVLSEFCERVCVAMERKFEPTLKDEPSSLDDEAKCGIGVGMTAAGSAVAVILQIAEVYRSAGAAYLEMRWFLSRVDVDQITVGPQVSSHAIQGIDHALALDSSQ